MAEAADIVCFHCGCPVGDPPALNTLSSGDPCPVCAERLLEMLPPIFHAPMPFQVAGEASDWIDPQVDSGAEVDSEGDADPA